MYQEQSNAATRRPDLAEILDSLRQQIDYAGKYGEQIFMHTNQFKDCRQPSPEDPSIKSKEPQGVVEMLKAEIERLRNYNNVLRMSAEGLQSIVGS